MNRHPSDLLAARVRSGGSDPLVTYYDLDADERTELSATSFRNWVDKTSHLIVDELMVDPGDLIGLSLARSHPGHWVTLVWQIACWQVGVGVSLDSAGTVAANVVGPDWTGYVTSSRVETVACSLHPLGLGFQESLPTGMIDYGLEVRGQPDEFAAERQPGDAVAWIDADRRLTLDDLVAGEPPPPGRRLIRPTDPWSTTRDGLLAALRSSGSAVVVVGGTDEGVAHIASSELTG